MRSPSPEIRVCYGGVQTQATALESAKQLLKKSAAILTGGSSWGGNFWWQIGIFLDKSSKGSQVEGGDGSMGIKTGI